MQRPYYAALADPVMNPNFRRRWSEPLWPPWPKRMRPAGQGRADFESHSRQEDSNITANAAAEARRAAEALFAARVPA